MSPSSCTTANATWFRSTRALQKSQRCSITSPVSCRTGFGAINSVQNMPAFDAASAHTLYTMLFSHLEDKLTGVNTLTIVPDSLLSRVAACRCWLPTKVAQATHQPGLPTATSSRVEPSLVVPHSDSDGKNRSAKTSARRSCSPIHSSAVDMREERRRLPQPTPRNRSTLCSAVRSLALPPFRNLPRLPENAAHRASDPPGALRAGEDATYLGRANTESAFWRSVDDGSLQQAGVIAFATHGLSRSDAAEMHLTEPRARLYRRPAGRNPSWCRRRRSADAQ